NATRLRLGKRVTAGHPRAARPILLAGWARALIPVWPTPACKSGLCCSSGWLPKMRSSSSSSQSSNGIVVWVLLRRPSTCFRAVPNKGEPSSPTFVEGPNRCVQHLLFVMAIPTKVTRPNLYRAGALLLLTASVLGPATSGEAHDWYPAECCHAIDCAPVESWAFAQTVQSGSLPQISVTTKHGTAIVPQN